MTGLPVFFAAMFLLNITPGPDMLYVLARGPVDKTVAVAQASVTRFAQTVERGLIFDCSGTFVNVIVALAASSYLRAAPRRGGDAMRNRIGGAPVFRWLTGGVFIGLGVRLPARDA
jgi:threonine/homoserine/homoserine lactone efflux protein